MGGAVNGGSVKAEWFDIERRVDAAVGEWGRRADALVLKRPDRLDPPADRQAVHAALFDTDRPVLMVPPTPTGDFGIRIAIAWRDERRAIRAVLAGLRSLARAERVYVLAGVRAAGAPRPVLPPILEEHGVTAELHILQIGAGVFGAALLAKAHALGADLLVMGAYLHSPMRELLLGGVTRHVLAHADIPVLMRH